MQIQWETLNLPTRDSAVSARQEKLFKLVTKGFQCFNTSLSHYHYHLLPILKILIQIIRVLNSFLFLFGEVKVIWTIGRGGLVYCSLPSCRWVRAYNVDNNTDDNDNEIAKYIKQEGSRNQYENTKLKIEA